MKKVFLTAASVATLLFCACDKEDTIVNEVIIPSEPSEVATLEATSLFQNNILVDWEILKELEGDNIVYDVSVNGQVLGSKITSSSVNIDGTQFQNGEAKEVVLEIVITAFGTVEEEQQTLLTYEATEVVKLNDAPKQFSIQNLFLNADAPGQLLVQFTAPVDLDGDQLVFDFIVDDEVVTEGISFETQRAETIIVDQFGRPLNGVPLNNNNVFRVGASLNEFAIQYDFSDKLTEDVTVKIVAKDQNGGESEAEAMFNAKATDVDFGVLSNDTTNTINIDLTNEVDAEVSYKFTLEETIGVSFAFEDGSQVFNDITLRVLDGENVLSTLNIDESGEFIDAGRYEILFDTSFSRGVVLETFEENSQDKDLGLLSLPFESVEEIEFFRELDGTFTYTFEVDQEVDYRFTTEEGLFLDWNLLNVNTQQFVNSGFSDREFNSRFGQRLVPGVYEISISERGFSNIDEMNLQIFIEGIEPIQVSSVGAVALPFSQEYDLELNNDLFDNRVFQVFEFEIAESASYLMSTDVLVDFVIKDEFGNRVRSNSFTRVFNSFGRDLQRGKYTLELSTTGNGVPTKLNFNLSDEFEVNNQLDVDLGQVTLPFTSTQDFDFTTFLGNRISYTFEITEESSYSIGTGLSETSIVLYRISNGFDQFISSNQRGIINASENALTPGIYRIDLNNSVSNAVAGQLLITLD